MMTSLRPRIEKIQQFQLDEPEARFPFSARLAQENRWSIHYSQKVCREYLRFVALMAISDKPLSPSSAVDQAWHLHLSYSRSYWERLCRETVGRPLHHEPTKGGSKESEKFEAWYERTFTLYEEVFEEAPPSDIWPSPGDQHKGAAHRWIDTNQYWVISKRLVSKTFAALGLCFVTVVCLAWAAPNANAPFPFNLNGSDFISFYILGLLGAIGISLVFRAIQFNAPPDDEMTLPQLSPNEIALLQGGSERAITSAIYSLKHRGNIEIDSTPSTGSKKGDMFIARPIGKIDHDASLLEQKIFAYLSGGDRTLISVCREMKPVCDSMEEALTESQLINPKGFRGLQGLDLLAILPICIMIFLGVIRCFQGVANHRPILFLVFGVIAALVILVPLTRRWGNCTSLGRRVLREQESQAASLRSKLRSSSSAVTANDMLLGIALFGPFLWSVPESSDLGMWVEQSHRKMNSGNTTSSSCGSSCGGSSCGGGGGGGGCGGCGGGGGD